jgi:hypothetical protein
VQNSLYSWFPSSNTCSIGTPETMKVGGAGLRARRFCWHRLQACAPHRQDAGATKKFVLVSKLSLGALL